MGQLYLIRHGKTALNGTHATDRIRGWVDVPLDPSGRAQAKELALMFESKGLDCIHSSDLSRASDTADAIAKRAGLQNEPDMAFRPWNLGEFQGQESADVAPAIRDFVMRHPTDPVPGGESFTQFEARFLPAFHKLLDEAKSGKTVGLVTHYRCVKLAESWVANGQQDQMAIKPEEFLKADLEPADVLCVYWDAPTGKWAIEEEDAPGDRQAAEEDYVGKQILCEIAALMPGETRQRIQVFPAPGEYVHPRSGKFTLTQNDLDEFAANIDATDSIPADRDHAFYKGQSAPAAGWFISGTAESTADGVWADMEWTELAAEQIRNREYRYISPEFSFQKRESSGKKIPEPTLHAVTLTNRPFFTDMQPVAADALEMDEHIAALIEDGLLLADDWDNVPQIAAAAASKQPYGNVSYADPGYQKDGKKRYPIDTEEHIRSAWSYINKKSNAARYSSAQLSRIKARIRGAMKKIGASMSAEEGEHDMDVTVLAESLGLTADASEDDVLEAASKVAAENAELKAKLDAAPDPDAITKLIADAQEGVTAAKELREMKRDAAINQAIEEGKIVPAHRASYEAMYALDPEGVTQILADLPASVPFKPTGEAAVFDAEGKQLQRGENGDLITADVTPVKVGGIDTPVAVDTARVVAAAEADLRSQGKTEWTDDEFAVACEAAMSKLGIEREYAPEA